MTAEERTQCVALPEDQQALYVVCNEEARVTLLAFSPDQKDEQSKLSMTMSEYKFFFAHKDDETRQYLLQNKWMCFFKGTLDYFLGLS